MTERDGMTLGQYLAACCLSLFSPISRLLPKGVLHFAGMSGWLAPLAAFPLLAGLLWLINRTLTVNGQRLGLAQALRIKLGKGAGNAVILLFCIWMLFYGGFLLRSGGERLLSTVYPTGSMRFFLPVLLFLSTLLAYGSLRAMGRVSSVALLLFALALILVFAMALPTVRQAYIWPPNVTETGGILLSAVPVFDVLSPWVWFSFLAGSVRNGEGGKRKSLIAAALMIVLTVLFLVCTIGILGPELSRKQQFPFFVMVKNLRLFNVAERFDSLVIVLWMMTDYVCIGMLLRSVSEGVCTVLGRKWQKRVTVLCAAAMLAVGFLIAPDAFRFERISEFWVPVINLVLILAAFPILLLFAQCRKISKNKKIGVDNSGKP